MGATCWRHGPNQMSRARRVLVAEEVARMRAGSTLAVTASVAAALAGRYAAGRRQEDKQTTADLEGRLTNLGEVNRLSILPLVERHTSKETLRGEPGVSYLIRADELTMLFDAGLGLGRGRTALESNAEDLGVRLDDIDCLVVSHLHADHVGGPAAQLRHTFRFGIEQLVPRSLPACSTQDSASDAAARPSNPTPMTLAFGWRHRLPGRLAPARRPCRRTAAQLRHTVGIEQLVPRSLPACRPT
jgi:hypothetical protein